MSARGPPPPPPAGRKSIPARPVVAKIRAIEMTAATTIPAIHNARLFRPCRTARVYVGGRAQPLEAGVQVPETSRRPSRPIFGSWVVRISPQARHVATTMPPKLPDVPALGVVICQSCLSGSRVSVMAHPKSWSGRPDLDRRPPVPQSRPWGPRTSVTFRDDRPDDRLDRVAFTPRPVDRASTAETLHRPSPAGSNDGSPTRNRPAEPRERLPRLPRAQPLSISGSA